MRTFMPLPTARSPVPMAAVVLPLPGPVLMRMRPVREEVIETGDKEQGTGNRNQLSVPIGVQMGFYSLFPTPVPCLSVAGVIWMSSQNCTCAVELLGEDEAG